MLFLFQTLIKSKFFSSLLKQDVSIPSLYANLISTNINQEFFGLDVVVNQFAETLQERLDYVEDKDGREWFFATVAASGSGKTFLCYHLLKLAMSGKFGEFMRSALGQKYTQEYDPLIEKLKNKIVGVQVNCNGIYKHNDRMNITSERDTCLRMMCSYYLNHLTSDQWKKFYEIMCHLMPFQMERMVELILMDWEEKTGKKEDTPFFFICYDESNKVGHKDEVINYVHRRNLMIEHFEHVDLSEEMSDLTKIKIVSFFTALEPIELAKENDLHKTKASDRKINWVYLPDLRSYLEKLIPIAIRDENTKFLYKLGLYWTNGNPRITERVLNKFEKKLIGGELSKSNFVECITKASKKELQMKEEDAWKFAALILCRFSTPPSFYVSNPYKVETLFLEAYCTSPSAFPLVQLFFKNQVIEECVTSKLYLKRFVENQPPGEKNEKIILFLNNALEEEIGLKKERWENYIANLFAAHLSCWSFILQSQPQLFESVVSVTDTSNLSNINLRNIFKTSCIPLSQLFHFEPENCGTGKKCSEVLINLKLKDAVCEWKVMKDFIPEESVFEAGGIYLPKKSENPGWDLSICFLNEKGDLSAVFFQSRDSEDGKERYLSPLKIGESICKTKKQIKIIQQKSCFHSFKNFFYF